MLRVSDHFHATDVGRMRQGNEDNFYVRSPLFAVCDGMGGAQAGEVASEIAARSFEVGIANGEAPEAGLTRIIEGANAKIHERSHSDAGRAGMGCTCTAAYVDHDGVAIAHVGDSRAYRLRDGELKQLTRDHSLIADLIELGKITPEEAERHPQRSVITRALGPEPEVEVDTKTHGAKPGDVYLLCSDGLTSMVPDARILPVLTSDGDLGFKGRQLIAAANAAGGRDNITVILFALDEARPRGAAAAEQETGEQPTAYLEYDEAELAEPGPRQGITKAEAEAATRAGDTAPHVSDVERAVQDAEAADWEARRPATVALSAIRPGQPLAGQPEMAPPPAAPQGPPAGPPTGPPAAAPPPAIKRTVPLPDEPKRRSRAPVFVIAVIVVLAILLTAGWLATRAVYFLGVDSANANAVAIYRGLPYELPGGVKLYERYAVSGVTIGQLAPARRETFTDHKLRSRDDAEDLVNQLELGRLE